MKLSLLPLLAALFLVPPSYAQTRQQTDNLYTFARLYGYVRYFHPDDGNVLTEWDKLAIYGAQQVAKADNERELQLVLEKLFKPIAPGLRIYPTGTTGAFDSWDFRPADTTNMKTVMWQHTGYAPGGSSTIYRSLRTNSYIKRAVPREYGNFSTISNSIDAKPYRERMFRYSAAIKAEDLGEGSAQLWLRVDRKDDQRGFFDNMNDRPVTGVRKAWRRVSISGKVDPDAEIIAFGCFVTNKGSLLIDDIKLEMETADGWETVKGLNGGFETDTPGIKPAYWNFSASDGSFTVKATDKQAASGKQALYMERDQSPGNMERTTTLFPTTLPPGTVIKKDIGSGLSITMPVALWGDGNRTYPLTDTAAVIQRNKVIAAKYTIAFTGDNLYVRLADVIMAWNVIQHFHPYYAEWATNWDNDLREALAACYKDRTATDFIVTLKTFLAKMRDGHVYISAPSPRQPGFLPIRWEWVEKQLVITRVMAPGIPLQVGDVVNYINGTSAAAYIDSVSKIVFAGSPGSLTERTTTAMLTGFKNDGLQLSVTSPDNSSKKVSLTYSQDAGEFYKRAYSIELYRPIDSGIVYVNLVNIQWTDLSVKLPDLAKASAVIFDMRGYPQNESPMKILSNLMQQPENTKWMHIQEIVLPDHARTGWQSSGWNLAPSEPHIGGKVFFLTNSNAVSYAESIMGYVKGLKLGTIIGEPTAGANGNVNQVALPGGYGFQFTGMKVTNHDGSQHFMKGIQPDITVQRTVKGIQEGRDELLDKALEICK